MTQIVIVMTPRQIELARHALGLPTRARRSYRNRFYCGPGHGDFNDWTTMATCGWAKATACLRDPPFMFWIGATAEEEPDYLFRLTQAGAKAALRKGEKLCPEDFPPGAA